MSSRVSNLWLLIDPGLGFVERQPHQRNVIASETCRLFPKVTIAKETRDGDRVPQSIACAFSPDSDFDQTTANLMNRLTDH